MKNEKRNIGVIGCGIWGRNIVRNFYNLNALNTVCDIDKDNIEMIKKNYPSINVTNNFEDLLNNKEIEELIKARKITDPKTLIAFFLYKDMINE